MADRAVLQTEIEASGMVTGARTSVRSLDEIKRAAAGGADGLRKYDTQLQGVGSTLARMAGGYLAATVGVAGVVAGVKNLAHAALEAEENERRLEAAVRRRGDALGTTTDKLLKMATALESTTRFADDDIQKAMAVLLRFDEIDSSNIERVTQATLDFAQATGQDAAQAATSLGKALLVPGEAMRALKEVGVTLTQAQQDQIDSWNKTGQSAKSVDMIVGLLNKTIGGEAVNSAKTAAGAIDQLDNAFDNLKETLGGGATGGGAAGGLRLVAAAIKGIDESLKTGVGKRLLELASVPVAWSIAKSLVDGWHQLAGGAKAAADGIEAVGNAAAGADPKLAKMQDTAAAFVKGFQDALGGFVEKALEEDARAAEEFAAKVKALTDRLDPAGAAARQLAAETKILNGEIAAGRISGDQAILTYGNLTGTWEHAADLAANLAFETLKVATAQERLNAAVGTGATDGSPGSRGAIATGTVTKVTLPLSEMDQAAEDFTRDLSQGMGQAVADFAREFVETGEINVKRLGDMLLDVLLDAAQQYFARMVANQAQLKMTGGGGTSGTGGMGAAMGTFGSVLTAVAVAYAVVEITKGIKAANDAGKFKETAAAGVYRGGIGSTYAGELSDQGRQMADALRDFLNLMQSVAGEWITSLPELGVRVSGDGKKFQALVGGEVIGVFSSMSEAMVRGFQVAFSEATFSSEIDPIIRDMVTNFRGSDIEELKTGLRQVRSMLDEVAGLSEVEIAIRDLPFQAEALKQKMVQLGASFEDASALAAKWQATQMQGLRDQITGHEQTVAEQRAQKEREALMFNAQLALNKAEIDMKREKLRADVEILRAGGSLNQADLNLTTQYLGQVGRLTDVKAQLANQDLQIQQGHVNLMTEAGRAALAALELQLAALDQVYAILDSIKPIDLKEIRIPGVGGHGGGTVNTGPSEEEQRAADFANFLRDNFRSTLSDLAGTVYDLNAAFAAQAQAAAEVEGGEAALAEARRVAFAQLREDVIDGLGSPMEALRDRLAAMREAIEFLWSTTERTEGAVARLTQVIAELQTQARMELLGLAAEIADAFGLDQRAAEFRAQIAELDLRLKVIQLRLLYQEYQALGLIGDLLEQTFKDLFLFIEDPENWPNFHVPNVPPPPPPPVQDPGDHGASAAEAARARREQALISALDRLRNIFDSYVSFRENLQTSELSGHTLQQRSTDAFAQYETMLAQARAGNLDAIQNLPGMANQYLELLGQFIDPSSAQYQQIRDQILAQMAGIEGGIAGLLNGANNPQQQAVEELQTIAQILNEIRLLWGGNPVWNPGAGNGTIHPGPGPRPSDNHGGLSTAPRGRNGAVQVEDVEARVALARMEAKLEAGLARVAGATKSQTEYQKARDLRSPARGGKVYGTPESDRIAS